MFLKASQSEGLRYVQGSKLCWRIEISKFLLPRPLLENKFICRCRKLPYFLSSAFGIVAVPAAWNLKISWCLGFSVLSKHLAAATRPKPHPSLLQSFIRHTFPAPHMNPKRASNWPNPRLLNQPVCSPVPFSSLIVSFAVGFECKLSVAHFSGFCVKTSGEREKQIWPSREPPQPHSSNLKTLWFALWFVSISCVYMWSLRVFHVGVMHKTQWVLK